SERRVTGDVQRMENLLGRADRPVVSAIAFPVIARGGGFSTGVGGILGIGEAGRESMRLWTAGDETCPRCPRCPRSQTLFGNARQRNYGFAVSRSLCLGARA